MLGQWIERRKKKKGKNSHWYEIATGAITFAGPSRLFYHISNNIIWRKQSFHPSVFQSRFFQTSYTIKSFLEYQFFNEYDEQQQRDSPNWTRTFSFVPLERAQALYQQWYTYHSLKTTFPEIGAHIKLICMVHIHVFFFFFLSSYCSSCSGQPSCQSSSACQLQLFVSSRPAL